MLYTNNSVLFRQYVEKAVRVADHQVLVLPGIATTSAHNISSCEEVVRQTRISPLFRCRWYGLFQAQLKGKKLYRKHKKNEF